MPPNGVATRSALSQPGSPGTVPGGPAARARESRSAHTPAGAVLPLLIVSAVLTWWGWKAGAYFRVSFLPGSMILLGLTVALLRFAPWPGALRGAARVAFVSLLLLALWILLSALWSPSPDIAVGDATRVAVYGLAFGLGIWICLLLGRRMVLALAPMAVATGLVGLITVYMLWTGDDAGQLLDSEGTLRYPLGYRNADAAFFLIGLFPAIVLASRDGLDWRLRGVLLASSTLALELAVMAQSRAALYAFAFGLAAFIAAHPSRLRALAWLLLAALPAALALPWLLEVFQRGAEDTPASLPALRTAGAAIAATTALSGLLGCLAARADPGVQVSQRTRRALGGVALAALGMGAVVALVTVVTAEGGPVGFVEERLDELTAGSPDLRSEGSRYGLDVSTERGDLWRVGLDDFVAHPATGEGGGGFRFSYLLDRESGIQPEDPHSVEILMLSELGLPGLLLFAGFVVAATAGALRARRLGPAAAALCAGAAGMGGYWFMHASVDWFWTYPALTLPVVFVLGAAAAPALLQPAGPPRMRLRRALIAAAVLAALAMIPPLLSERYTNDALRNWQADLAEAYAHLERAADLNPLSDRPLAAEAVIAEEAGEPQRALGALSRAQQRVPEEWTLYYLEARIEAPIDPEGAARALDRARELNPSGPEVDELQAELGL